MTTSNLYSQGESPYTYMNTKDGIIFINNEKDKNYTVKLFGDSINTSDSIIALEVDDKYIQIIDFEYSTDKYSIGNPKEKEIELLKEYMNSDIQYFENEVFNTKLNCSGDVILNKVGKRFLLWNYKVPDEFSEQYSEISDPIQYQYYLSFIAKQSICCINFSFYDLDTTKHVSYIKKVADEIQIFGLKVNLKELWYKTEELDYNDVYVRYDSINNFKCQIYDWCNIIDIPDKSIFGMTAPDIDNIQNAIMVFNYPKNKFKSFKDFNEFFITGNKAGKAPKENSSSIFILMKENEPPKNCNGLDYTLYFARGKTMFYCRYLTYKTKKSYYLIKFVATQETYDLNIKRFEDFVSKFELIE